MDKYLVLMHPSNSMDLYILDNGDFSTFEDAYNAAKACDTHDFIIAKKVEFEVIEKSNNGSLNHGEK